MSALISADACAWSCTKHGKRFATISLKFEDRDHVMLWIAERQLGRRNLTDDQRSMVSGDVAERRSKIAMQERAEEASKVAALVRSGKSTLLAKSANKVKPPINTRTAVAKEAGLPERKVRLAVEIKKADVHVANMVRAGTVSLTEGKKLTALAPEARKTVGHSAGIVQ